MIRLIMLALMLVTVARADEAPKHLVLADLGLHVVGVGYRHTVLPVLAVEVDFDSYTPWTQNIDLLGLSGAAHKADVGGLLVRARLFVHPFGDAPSGWWVSPFAQTGSGSATRDGTPVTGNLWAVGASVGYAGMVSKSVHIGFGAGMQFHAAQFPGGQEAPTFARAYPTLDATIGYAF